MSKPPLPEDENAPGLLHHAHAGKMGNDAYHPHDTADHLPATSALIEEAATATAHGIVREPGHKLGREEEAKLALEHTQISAVKSWVLVLGFLATIGSIPLVQSALEVRQNMVQRQQEIAESGTSETSLLPRIFEVRHELPSASQLKSVHDVQSAWSLIPSADQFKAQEDQLQQDSFLVQWTLPRVQNLLVRVGAGNEQAYCGRPLIPGRPWLHYRPDVDYVTSRGFLDPGLLKVRARAGDSESNAVQPDPVRAIVDFKNQLEERGIKLILMPTPVKTMMHPEALSTRFKFGQGILQNPSYAHFRQELQKHGVLVFDISDTLLQEMRRTGRPQYLETDTHWIPSAMERSARELANYLRREVQLRPREPEGYTRGSKEVANLGDIAEMLRLPQHQKAYPRQQVRIHPVQTSDGELWYPSHRADVLLLGDSFSNIYSLEGMNWGESAGFAEQLSYELQRPVDSITNNAGGSHVTRERLVKEMQRGRDRLRGKRVVIWQFAMRDLLIGDWKMLRLPEATARTS